MLNANASTSNSASLLSSNSADSQIITIHYNDRSVQIDPKRPMPIKWVNSNKKTAEQRSKNRQSNPEMPVPRFRHVEPIARSERAKTLKIPTSYVQYKGIEESDQCDRRVEYDLDREDLIWLKLMNARREQKGRRPIEEETLERAIDALEKESHFQFTQAKQTGGGNFGFLPFVDNDAPCCICDDGEDSNANQIIFCDMCNIAVHQDCYGVPYIPEGQWLCRRCQLSPSVQVNCALCPHTAGAFKQTADGRWVHVKCAIWLHEVHFANTVFMEPVEGVDFSIKRRHKLTCLVCKRKVGACLQCSYKSCMRSFHVTCGLLSGMFKEIKEGKTRNNPNAVTINRFIYCHEHTLLKMENGKSAAAWKREVKQMVDDTQKMLETSSSGRPRAVLIPVIPQKKVEEIANALNIEHISDICAYWSLKRKSRLGVPLIRRLQVYVSHQKPITGRLAPEDLDEDEASTSATDPRETSQLDPMQRFANLRRDFERVRLLCELLKKREKLKKEVLVASEQMVKRTLKPVSMIIGQTLDKLVEKDHQMVFTQPVDEEEVQGYSKIILKPMDFAKMRERLASGRYKKLAHLRADFLQMMRNCAIFNRDNQYFYNYGQRIKRIGANVIKAAEVEEEGVNEYSAMLEQDDDWLLGLLRKELDLRGGIEEGRDKPKGPNREGNRPREGTKRKSVSTKLPKRKGKNMAEEGAKKVALLEKEPTPVCAGGTQDTTLDPGAASERDDAKIVSPRKPSTSGKRERAGQEQKLAKEAENPDTGKKRERKRKAAPLKAPNADSEHKLSTPKNGSADSTARRSNKRQQKTAPKLGTGRPAAVAHLPFARPTGTHLTPALSRGVDKQSYSNAYLTEASSAAEEEGSLDFTDLEHDYLPTTPVDEHHRLTRSSAKQLNTDFDPPSPSSFSHNDIVLGPMDERGAVMMPGRVIDLRMRFALDSGDEEEHGGLGRHFVDQALCQKPRDAGEGHPAVLVVFFDKNNTLKWTPGNQLRLLCTHIDAEFDPNAGAPVRGNNRPFLEAMEKAKQFWRNVVQD